jgi:predicted benzoate:H+ symporter BenE
MEVTAMAMHPSPKSGDPAVRHYVAGICCAWISLLLPICAGIALAVIQPMLTMLPDPVYWTIFGCGLVGTVIGGVALATVRRQPNLSITTPAILGIVCSVALAFFGLGFGILGFGSDPSWGQIFPWQGPPPGEGWQGPPDGQQR